MIFAQLWKGSSHVALSWILMTRTLVSAAALYEKKDSMSFAWQLRSFTHVFNTFGFVKLLLHGICAVTLL